MAKSFFLAPGAWHPPFILDGAEAHHLAHVARIRPGESVRLFDGEGREGIFTVVSIGKNKVHMEMIREKQHSHPQGRSILAIGWGKNLRRTWLLEKTVEFEAGEVWFWQAERSQGSVPKEPKEVWYAQLIAGAKQCGNLWLPTITTLPGGVGALIEKSASLSRRYFLWEEEGGGSLLSGSELRSCQPIVYIIGPEGGFTPREAETLIAAGIPARSLGRQVLRWETAALLCLGLHWWANQAEETAG